MIKCDLTGKDGMEVIEAWLTRYWPWKRRDYLARLWICDSNSHNPVLWRNFAINEMSTAS